MKSIRSSLRDLDRLHPLLAGIFLGLFVVAGHALLVPGALDRTQAWGLGIVTAAGGGLGRWLQVRCKESRETS